MEDFNGVLKRMAAHGLQTQKIRDGDYVRDGMLICGRCGCKRQSYKEIDGELVKVAIQCDCDKRIEALKKAEEEARKHKEEVEDRKRRSLMDSRYYNVGFCTYHQNEFNSKAFRVAQKYVENFQKMKESNQGLLFYGPVGTGKSHTAACIANELMERDTSVIMTSFAMILSEISADMDGESRLMERLTQVGLVIFDDFGIERRTTYGLEKVYHILDARYRSKKPMIITTNLQLRDMKEEVDINYKRLYDRIFEACFPVLIDGPSWRMQEGKRRSQEMKELLGV